MKTVEQVICETSHGMVSLENTQFLLQQVVKLRAELKVALMTPAQLSSLTHTHGRSPANDCEACRKLDLRASLGKMFAEARDV